MQVKVLQSALTCTAGNWYQLADGTRRSVSLVNLSAFDFSIPHQYKAADFPFNSTADFSIPALHGSVHQPAKPGTFPHPNHTAAKSTGATAFDSASLYRAHFLSLCMKMVYEKQEVIADIASQSFGCQLQGYLLTSDKQTKKKRHESSTDAASKRSKAGFVPRTLAIVLDLPKAKVVAFRGTEPTNLINMRSSGSIGMTHPEGMGGVHDGFWTALMYESKEKGGPNLFQRLVDALQEGDQQQDIYLTGKGLDKNPYLAAPCLQSTSKCDVAVCYCHSAKYHIHTYICMIQALTVAQHVKQAARLLRLYMVQAERSFRAVSCGAHMTITNKVCRSNS